MTWFNTSRRLRKLWQDEKDYWDWFCSENSRKYWRRLDPSTELDNDIREKLLDIGAKARILDVGAGPLTILGKCWDGIKLNITAVDPLANHYNSILAKYGIKPVVRTIQCESERLKEVFGESQFDLVYARNLVNHSYDALKAIQEMVAVTKPGGFVMLENILNNENYPGKRLWNLDLQSDRLILWNRDRKVDLSTAVSPFATVIQACRLADGWFLAVLQKTAE